MDQAVQKILESGLGWVVCVILAGVIVYLYKENRKLYDKRLEEAEKAKQEAIAVRDNIAEPLKYIQEYTKLIFDKLITEKERVK